MDVKLVANSSPLSGESVDLGCHKERTGVAITFESRLQTRSFRGTTRTDVSGDAWPAALPSRDCAIRFCLTRRAVTPGSRAPIVAQMGVCDGRTALTSAFRYPNREQRVSLTLVRPVRVIWERVGRSISRYRAQGGGGQPVAPSSEWILPAALAGDDHDSASAWNSNGKGMTSVDLGLPGA
mgnify:CR=1 FL=1